jgi:hypothetical protein
VIYLPLCKKNFRIQSRDRKEKQRLPSEIIKDYAESEWATDLIFDSPDKLTPIKDSLLHHAHIQ